MGDIRSHFNNAANPPSTTDAEGNVIEFGGKSAGACIGDFLLLLATHLRTDVNKAGTDVDVLASRIRNSAVELEELASELGATMPPPPAPRGQVIASPQPGQGNVGGWGASPAAQAPQRLPPNSMPAVVGGPQDQGHPPVDEPAPGENAILDMHRANLSALGVPRMT